VAKADAFSRGKVKLGPHDFFEAVHDFFLSQAQVVSVKRREYEIAGSVFRTEIAGETLSLRLSRALTHLPRPRSPKVGLTIYAWDGAMIPPPWSENDYGPRGEVRGFNTERFCTVFDHGTGSLSMLDRDRGLAFFWTRAAADMPAYETGAPLRTILTWWLEQENRILIHGGAVAREHGAALLVGPGGSGKSTTALLCLQAGWRYLADDYCVIEPGSPPTAFSLYNTAKLARRWLPRMPQLQKLREASSEMHADKHLLFLHELCPDELIHSATGRLLMLPSVSGQTDTTVSSATAGEALRALAPSTIFQGSASGLTAFRLLSKLVEQIPIRRLDLGSELDQVAPQIDRCMSDL
jgi:hypothetical protein